MIREQAGFTLLEMLLSAAIISMLVGASLPIYETFIRRNDLDLTAQRITAMLRRAETYAQAVNYDNDWSVEIQSSAVTLFQGTNFVGRNTAYDETLSMPATVTPSGTSEVRFTKFTAAPNAAAVTTPITLTSTANSTRTIILNAKGMVDY